MNGLLRILRRPPLVKSAILTLRTEQKLLAKGRDTKAPNEFGPIFKISEQQVLLGRNYEDMVNETWIRNAVEDIGISGDIPEFRAEELWKGYGFHDGMYTVRHRKTGRRYLYYFPLKKGESHFVNEYGERTAKEVLGEYLPLYYEPKSGVTWRTVALENITRVEYADWSYDIVCTRLRKGHLEDYQSLT